MSTTGTHLGNTPMNLAKLRELSRRELPEILDKVRFIYIKGCRLIKTCGIRFEEKKVLF